MREGNLEAPTRHPYHWQDPDFTDAEKLDAELRRVFDICHGCRRCFNLCDSFPRLFDLVDAAGEAEMEGVKSEDFKSVVDACTLCDMCFLTKCPYVPPHQFNLDFPHLMVRYRALELKQGRIGFIDRQITETDRNGKIATAIAGLVNWATRRGNVLTRPLMELIAFIHRDAELPRYAHRTLERQAALRPPPRDLNAPAAGRKAALFATCFAEYNTPEIGMASLAVLAKNGVDCQLVYPGCCGMPQLEHGDLPRLAEMAKKTAAALLPLIEQGYDIVAPVPSCALMMKFEWPLIVPGDEKVARLAQAMFDISEYVVDIARKEGLAPGLSPIEGGVTLHLACHARAQNMGAMGAEMLRQIPDSKVMVVERCSGHGGSLGIKKDFFEVGLKIGKPAMNQIAKNQTALLCSECPLAGAHLLQGLESIAAETKPAASVHPIQILARSYGLTAGEGR
jgi:glycerol-3-phosphate dehydrogenase subunit C